VDVESKMKEMIRFPQHTIFEDRLKVLGVEEL
jgi:hypothetical protein